MKDKKEFQLEQRKEGSRRHTVSSIQDTYFQTISTGSLSFWAVPINLRTARRKRVNISVLEDIRDRKDTKTLVLSGNSTIV